MNDKELESRIAANLASVRARMTAALVRAGRPADAARLVAVTKYATDEQVRALHAAGQRAMAENRVVEAAQRIERLALPGVAWHLIGHLQRNKARRAVGPFSLIHSVDSERLLRALADAVAAASPSAPLPILLQFNPAGEASKSGFAWAEAEAALRAADEVAAHLRVEGFMAMAPLADDPESARPHFAALRAQRDRLATPERPLAELSMGMSGDFEVALEEGATLVRIGSALFA